MKFAANLNFLFTEGSSLAERLRLAHRAGFHAVEIPFPAQEDEIVQALEETGIEIALINISLGTNDAFKLGCASIPGAEKEFKTQLTKTINFAKSVKCNKIHIMAGLTSTASYNDCLITYTNNLKYAANELESANIIGLIEPINKYALPSYFMNSYETACSVLQQIKSQHLKLMLDIFHLQHIKGNVSHTFKELNEVIGHIQIAQVPHRHEPDVAGELDFSYIFSLIESNGYTDWIGCEYKPKSTTTEGLKWLSKYGLKL